MILMMTGFIGNEVFGLNVSNNSWLNQEAVIKQDWEKFSPKDRIFKIEMPATPTEKIGEQTSGAGKIVQRVYEVRTKQGEYLVSVAEFEANLDPSMANMMFDNGRDGMIKVKGYELISEQEIKFNNYPGRELVLQAPGQPPTIFKTRTYLVGQRLFQLLVIQPKTDSYPKSTIDYYNSLANKFFSSFELENIQ